MPTSGVLGVSVDFAWLHGLVTGDGCLFASEDGYKVQINCGHDEDLARAAQQCMLAVFGPDIPVKIKWVDKSSHGKRSGYYDVRCRRKAVYERLFGFEPNKGTHTWRVPERIKDAHRDAKGAWLAGLTDSDGCAIFDAARSARSIRISSVNETGLREAQALFASIGIEALWHAQDRRQDQNCQNWEFQLLICNQEALRKFRYLCPLRSPRKQAILATAVSSFRRRTTSLAEVERLANLAAELRQQGLGYDEIARRLSGEAGAPLDAERVRSWIKRHHPELLGDHGGNSAISRLLPAEFLESVRAGAEAGKTAKRLAAELDCKETKVRDALAQHFPALKFAAAGAGDRAVPQTVIDEIARRRLAGETAQQIAAATGQTASAVAQLACRLKLPKGKKPQ